MGGAALIEVVEGPGAGQRFVVEPGARAIIGRGKDVQLKIRDPGISREHLEIENRKDGVLVRDLASKHGARLDGRAIPREGVLAPFSCRIEVGKSKLKIALVPAPSAPPGLRLEEELGRGVSGVVYSAWQDPPGRRVAVKVTHEADDRVLLARARREAALLTRLDHPSIVRVHGLLEHQKRLYLVSELVVGKTLQAELAHGPTGWPRAVAVGAAVAAALAHAHGHGIVHRDVTPENIFLGEHSKAVKLADFGYARDLNRTSTIDGTPVTKTNDLLGSIHYVPPEQHLDAKRVGPECDVYGLGAVLYHAIAGAPPFVNVRPDELFRHQFRGPEPLVGRAREVPPRLSDLVGRSLAGAPEDRPDAATLARELGALAR